jgi:hypothetical protein
LLRVDVSDMEIPRTGDGPGHIAHDLAIRNFRLMENWHDAEASAILAPTMHNAESVAEPPGARQPGVAGARATYDWLHSAYADLRWTVHTVVAEGDWVVAHATMSGRRTGPFVTYTPDGEAGPVFAATGGASPRPDALVPHRRRTDRRTPRRS